MGEGEVSPEMSGGSLFNPARETKKSQQIVLDHGLAVDQAPSPGGLFDFLNEDDDLGPRPTTDVIVVGRMPMLLCCDEDFGDEAEMLGLFRRDARSVKPLAIGLTTQGRRFHFAMFEQASQRGPLRGDLPLGGGRRDKAVEKRIIGRGNSPAKAGLLWAATLSVGEMARLFQEIVGERHR